LGGFLAWLAEGKAICALHGPSMIMSRYKRGRGREIVAETIAGWTPVSDAKFLGRWRSVVVCYGVGNGAAWTGMIPSDDTHRARWLPDLPKDRYG
jgi:hypothetical protein